MDRIRDGSDDHGTLSNISPEVILICSIDCLNLTLQPIVGSFLNTKKSLQRNKIISFILLAFFSFRIEMHTYIN